jgi:hypothetical protein
VLTQHRLTATSRSGKISSSVLGCKDSLSIHKPLLQSSSDEIIVAAVGA